MALVGWAVVTSGPIERRVVVYVVLAFGLSWAWWLPMALTGTTSVAGRGWPTHLVGLVGPAAAAVVTTAVFDGRHGLLSLGRRCVRWRVDRRAVAIVAATAALAFVPVAVSGDAGLDDLARYSGAPQIGAWVVLVLLLVNGFGEELGWRGFLADHLLRTGGLRRAAVVTWVVWGLWHVPLFWVVEDFRDFGPFTVAGWIVGLFFGSVFLTWLYRFTERSVLFVALWHVAYNFAVATDAAVDPTPALVSMAVIVAAVVILRRETAGTGANLGTIPANSRSGHRSCQIRQDRCPDRT